MLSLIRSAWYIKYAFYLTCRHSPPSVHSTLYWLTAKTLLAGLFIEKIYWAVVESFDRQESEGVIDALVMSEHNGKPFSVPARSEFKVMACSNRLAWLELKPITGNLHSEPKFSQSYFGNASKYRKTHGVAILWSLKMLQSKQQNAACPGVHQQKLVMSS